MDVKSKASHLLQGEKAEQACKKFLRKQGLVFISNNFRCKHGEIDLIMQDGSSTVFVEVRYRADLRYGGGLASVTAAKQHKLRKTAEYYLQQHNVNYARFDVVSVTKKHQTTKRFTLQNNFEFTWIKDAF